MEQCSEYRTKEETKELHLLCQRLGFDEDVVVIAQMLFDERPELLLGHIVRKRREHLAQRLNDAMQILAVSDHPEDQTLVGGVALVAEASDRRRIQTLDQFQLEQRREQRGVNATER